MSWWRDPVLSFRLGLDFKDAIDRCRGGEPHKPFRSEAIRWLIGQARLRFLEGLLLQLADAGSKGRKVDGRTLNFMLSVVKGIAPKDRVEALLAAQMAVVHMAS